MEVLRGGGLMKLWCCFGVWSVGLCVLRSVGLWVIWQSGGEVCEMDGVVVIMGMAVKSFEGRLWNRDRTC